METIQAAVLGIIQGLTEFLPISSSGHLILIPALTKWEYFGKHFDVALHLGTLISLLIFYRRDMAGFLKNMAEGIAHPDKIKEDQEHRLPWLLIAGVIPAGIAGLLFDDVIETALSKPAFTASFLIIFGILLSIADTYSSRLRTTERPDSKSLSFRDAMIIGCAQAVALVPGVSRSGITMTAGMFLGMKKEEAANYSFLLSIPTIGAVVLYSGLKLLKDPLPASSIPIFLIGIAAAGISGYFVVKFLLDFLKKYSFSLFMYYRITLGLILIGMVIFGAL